VLVELGGRFFVRKSVEIGEEVGRSGGGGFLLARFAFANQFVNRNPSVAAALCRPSSSPIVSR
jgi:hypothetical protein